MKKVKNPFSTKPYTSKDLFCNREQELEILLRNFENGIDTTLISPRRMGKTGLILRFFDYLNEKEYKANTIYVDIFASRTMEDFVKQLAESVMKKYPERTSFGKKFMTFLKNFRTTFSYDNISGEPQIQISYQSLQEKEYTLKGLLGFLDNQEIPTVVAIDEFQQIIEYPEKNVEALLRTYIQQFNNIRFIFCGSKKTMMLDIFSNAKRPFFGITSYLYLDKIEYEKYFDFIKKHFLNNKVNIEDEAVNFILDWSFSHTFFTQTLCNLVFSIAKSYVDVQIVKEACLQILKQNEPIFLQYRQLLTPAQWNFLIAIAKEEKVKHITAQDFIARYNIGTPANAIRIAKSLLEKDLILVESDHENSNEYKVYDVFLLRWLKSTY